MQSSFKWHPAPVWQFGRGSNRKPSLLDFRFTVKWFLKIELPLIIAISYLSALGFLPSSLSYSVDIINLVLFVFALPKMPSAFSNAKNVIWAIMLFCLVCLLSAAINFVEPQYVIWEAICLWRIFIYACLVMVYWEWDDFEQLLNLFVKLQVVNVAFILIEYFILGCSQDTLGGMFGIDAGCNAGLNVYMCAIVAWSLRCYAAERGDAVTLAMVLISCLVIAAIAEIKLFYIEFIVIVLIQIILNRPTKRTLGILIGAVAAIGLGCWVFSVVFPAQFEILTDFDRLLSEADNSNIETGYGISRINAFGQISTQFFNNDLFYEMFGFGFGSASMSSIAFFSSPFSFIYGYLHYYFLQSAMLFLQMGYIGVAMYILPFAAMAIYVIRDCRHCGSQLAGILPMYIALFVIFLINCMYNSTAHTYFALFWAVLLIGPLLSSKYRVDLG